MNDIAPACITASTANALVFDGARIDADLAGVLHTLRIEQRFRNRSADHVEVVYTFPLPFGAVLLGVDVTLGSRQLTGTVVGRPEATARYEDALADGNAAVLLEHNADGSRGLSLGNLAPGEACTVVLHLAHTLDFEQGALRLIVPTVIAPRFGDPLGDGGLQPHQVVRRALDADYPLELTLRLHGALADATVGSPSHPVTQARSGSGDDAVITVTLARGAALDRDFVLVLDGLAQASLACWSDDSVAAGRVAALASFCPRVAAEDSQAVAVKLLVDCSGSMGGDSIAAARAALQAIVGQLEPRDRFALSRFGSTVEHRTRGLWKGTEAARLAARRWIGQVDADLGGTEMEAALASTFALANGASDVLLLTDGQIYAAQSTIEAARASHQRVFVVGIGVSAEQPVLRGLAEATGGACEFVAPGEAVQGAMLRMFARLRAPRLFDVQVEWPGTPLWTTAVPMAVFDGDTVQAWASLPGAQGGEVVLHARRAEGAAREVIGRACLAGEPAHDASVARMAAARRMADLNETDPAAAAEIGLAYQLVGPHTTFVLVHQRAEGERALDMPALRQVAHMLPAGWGGAGRANSVIVQSSCADEFAMSAPMMVRARAGSYGVGDRARLQALRLDIPAYLRRSGGDAGALDDFAAAGGARPFLDPHNVQYFATGEFYRGLTPLGLRLRLRHIDAAGWPKAYADLQGLGLGAWVLDWLELAVAPDRAGDGAPVWSEQERVAAFVVALVQLAALDAVAPPPTVPSVLRAAAPAALVARIATALASATASEWPDPVLDWNAGMVN